MTSCTTYSSFPILLIDACVRSSALRAPRSSRECLGAIGCVRLLCICFSRAFSCGFSRFRCAVGCCAAADVEPSGSCCRATTPRLTRRPRVGARSWGDGVLWSAVVCASGVNASCGSFDMAGRGCKRCAGSLARHAPAQVLRFLGCRDL
jgi:hypothetical protein